MSQEKTVLEVIAPTVEEALQKGLAQLNLPEEAVEVDVLDAGTRGLFGLGSRQARIRLIVKPPQAHTTPAVPAEKPAAASSAQQQAAAQEPAEVDEQDPTLRMAIQVVTELLEKMKVRAKVTATFRQPEEDDRTDEPVVMVSIEGNDLSVLIGRRSETLNALQYITSLIVAKRLDHWVPLMIDVQGYRARRELQLRQMARRMADQAVHTGRRQVLEPMPASERRLIHMELREHPLVRTESIGDEPNRKVTISLKKD